MTYQPIYPDQKYTPEEILASCLGQLHPQAVIGLDLFNRGEYFEAHEALELAWRAERGPVREVYRGILQVGVAYYHILNKNYAGALKMLKRSTPWLAPFPARCRGIDLESFRRDAARVEQALLVTAPAELGQFDTRLFKAVIFELER